MLLSLALQLLFGESILSIQHLSLGAGAQPQQVGEEVPLEADRDYRLCMELRGTGESGATLLPVLEQFDRAHRLISSFQLNAVSGTETTLSHDAQPGDTVLWVADASKWLAPTRGKIVALEAREDLSDLPNRNIEYYVEQIDERNGSWAVTMSRPLQHAWPAGTSLRQHCDGGFMTFGLATIELSSEWKTLECYAFAAPPSGGTGANLWRGVASAQLKLLAPKGVEVRGLRMEELDAQTAERLRSRRSIRGQALQSAVKVQKCLKTMPDNAALVVEVAGDGQSAFYQMDARWKVSQVRQVEFSAMTRQPGFFRFSGQILHADDSRQQFYSSPQMAVPDGEFHPIVFEIPQVLDTEALITNWELRWMGAPGIVGLASLEAQAEENLIPDARHLPVGRALPLDALKPHARYHLRWEGGTSPGLAIRFYDFQLKEFAESAVQLPAGESEMTFNTPEMLIQGCLTIDAEADGHPVLTLLDYHFPFAPYGKWRGKWIWDRPLDTGPYRGLVWFQRDFELPEGIEFGAVACLADDNAEWFVNGRRVGRSVIWTTPTRWEITEFLKPGKNRITVRVWNGTQAGGLAADVYVRAGGQDFFLDTDGAWTCGEETVSRTPPDPTDQPVVIYGAPETTDPWKRNINYRYAGPRGRLRLLEATPGALRALVVEPPPYPGRILHFALEFSDGRQREINLCATPDMGEWTAGKELTIHYPVPYLEEGRAVLRLADDFVAIEGNPALGQLDVPAQEPPAIRQAKLETGPRPMLLLGGERHNPTFYHTIVTQRSKRFHELQLAAEQGLRNFRVLVDFLDFWKSEGEFDFSVFDQDMAQLLTVCPDAIFCVHVYAHMPDWWLEANPDETSAHGDGGPRKVDREKQSLASKKWLVDAEIAIRRLVAHLKGKPYADRIWGMSIAENGNGEWFWTAQDLKQRPSWAGWAPCDTRNFRSFLRGKYGTDEALAAAWHTPGLTFDTAELPAPDAEKNASLGGEMLDPRKDQPVIDWFAFRNDALGQAICYFARVIKDATDGKWLAGFYYGYHTELASNPGLNLQMTGHNAFLEVARCPDVDFVSAPSRYTHRRIGMADNLMQPWDSFLMRGKQVYAEQDVRLSYSRAEADNMKMYVARPETALQSVGQMNRVLGMQLATGTLTYWFDIVSGSFYEPALGQLLTEQLEITSNLPPDKALVPVETAIVSSRESIYYSRANTATGIFRAAVEGTYQRFNELAAPYHSLVVEDLLDGTIQVPSHKFYVMLPTLVLTAEERAALMERFEREEATVVWLHCAGATYPGASPSAESNADFLGIQTRLLDERRCPEMSTGEQYGRVHCVNFNESGPWFPPVAGFDEVVGSAPDGSPLMVKKKIGRSTHYLCALMNLPPEVYAPIMDAADVHRYHLALHDPVWAGNDVLFLHASSSGPKTLNLRPGTRAKAIVGPFRGTLVPGETFEAVAGMTYGWLLEADGDSL
ncbi:MAG: beta-galactosidase [Victivallales bacterium]|nr:beta-galactosidase [Victivallales bacterium]